ncbi:MULTISPECIES: FeoB-associated Cys-rich membrane protein [unclassified Virgibacillus]|uniref:FeoB-associated Cys-rich membrane protein n=1 Tax=unclassified Virgibacillus TaxID=2620237 RepID=UPI0024DE65BF|nr:FeoB-associated Cys-rich membrane protein [Virgibacillus sp. LDC-1]
MMINVILIALIFGYGTYTLFRYFKKSSKGKCAACELNNTCSQTSCVVDENVHATKNQSL